MILVHEGWTTGGHLIDEHTEGPPIDRKTVTLLVQDLWCKVLSCTTEGVSLLCL